jgi:hypothetical protein
MTWSFALTEPGEQLRWIVLGLMGDTVLENGVLGDDAANGFWINRRKRDSSRKAVLLLILI